MSYLTGLTLLKELDISSCLHLTDACLGDLRFLISRGAVTRLKINRSDEISGKGKDSIYEQLTKKREKAESRKDLISRE